MLSSGKNTQNCTKENLNDLDNHDGVGTQLEPHILQWEVNWALGSITTNKVSEGEGIPAELFKTLKDDAVNVLHSICSKFGRLSSGHRTGKESGHIPVSKKGNSKECSKYHTTALISHDSKEMLKIFNLGFHST